MMLNGIPVYEHSPAVSRVAYIERMPIAKRRRRWRLVYRTKPAAIFANPGGLYGPGGQQRLYVRAAGESRDAAAPTYFHP